MKTSTRVILSIFAVSLLVTGYFLVRRPGTSGRSLKVMQWLRSPASHPEWVMQHGQRCGDAPFLFPTDGLTGYLWDDSFRPGHRHQGLDIFGGSQPGQTPVYLAYDGYLTRLTDWKSSVIVRIPSDPLKAGRQIWTYYTHMANANGESYIVPEFAAGTNEVFVKAGTLIGYQGNYSGDPANPVGVHLHFSIVLEDSDGRFRNELKIENTLDPSPYLGMALNGKTNPGEIPVCQTAVTP